MKMPASRKDAFFYRIRFPFVVYYMEKYKVGDNIFYGKSGACEIFTIGTLDFGKEDQIYYSLKPVMDSRSVVYVKVEAGDELFRPVMTKKEATAMLEKISDVSPSTYVIEKTFCEDLLKSGDQIKIAALVKQLRLLRKDTSRNRKGLNIAEERILRDAEKILYSEIASSLGLTMDEAREKLSIPLEA